MTTFRFSSNRFFITPWQSSIRRPCAHEDDAEHEERQLTSLAPDDDIPSGGGTGGGTATAADDQKHRNDRRGRNDKKRPTTKPKAGPGGLDGSEGMEPDGIGWVKCTVELIGFDIFLN